MVRTTSADRLAELAADPGITDDLGSVNRRLQTALKGTSWFRSRTGSPLAKVAYFSPEFGITEALPQYSGGLGVLAGDHLKAASDLGVPLVGVGLLYTEGYFRQRLDADGWQQESRLEFTPRSLGLTDAGVEITVHLAGDPVRVHVWCADVGRVPLFLLDTDVEGNSPEGVAVTDRLYGGDEHHRLRQEIVLGIGGVRALRALPGSPPRSSTATRATPDSWASSGCVSTWRRASHSLPPSRRPEPAGCSPPTPPSPPASTASPGR